MKSQPNALTQAVTDFVMDVYLTSTEAAKQDGVRSQDHFMDDSQRVF